MLKILTLAKSLKRSTQQQMSARKKYQERRFLKLLCEARKIPFWEKRLRDCHCVDDLHKVPPLTKKELMANFDEILAYCDVSKEGIMDFFTKAKSAELTESNHFAFRTSGTSGLITCLVIDEQDAERMVASSIAFGTVPSSVKTMLRAFSGKKMRIASIILESGHFPGTFYSHLMRRFVRVMNLVAHSEIVDIGQPIDEIINKLNTLRPEVWVSYPSMLRVLARQAYLGNLRVNPKHIICTSEPFDVHTQSIARQQFANVALHNVYGAGECPFIASSCRKEQLHLRPEVSILENVDENNVRVPDGAGGHHVLVTNLNNYAFPIIRFCLDDRITISKKKCGCGDQAPIIENIDGRTDDIFWLRPESQQIPIHPCAFEPPLINDHRVEEYQIIHDDDNHILIRIATKEEIVTDIKTALHQHLTKLDLHETLQVDFEFCDEIPRQVSGKFRRFVSKVPQDKV
ncbi:phenylacetate--CoA ligase family protein [Candidatus Uabimicrobium amorphum]|uniref:Coenzyme F390 synthetase n=1 Tax=Uabimicrobium amorphum TaxID=2596890 RepID=A0A5S9F2I5_UABAM|nr:phenylacetate--CoA ligase family protein [Candidatus Uabimicrobium amorphum]BBM83705.1 coenzyme F390 synthetase [Candidatus Uabimicrobium amorphum]